MSESSERPAATPTAAEIRRHYRVDCRIPVTFRHGAQAQLGSAMLANLGLGGARVDFPESVTPTAGITLFLPTGDGDPSELVLDARVVWAFSEPAADSPLHPTGLQFVHLEAPARRRLHDLIERLRNGRS